MVTQDSIKVFMLLELKWWALMDIGQDPILTSKVKKER
jgi:hypothetical protein